MKFLFILISIIHIIKNNDENDTYVNLNGRIPEIYRIFEIYYNNSDSKKNNNEIHKENLEKLKEFMEWNIEKITKNNVTPTSIDDYFKFKNFSLVNKILLLCISLIILAFIIFWNIYSIKRSQGKSLHKYYRIILSLMFVCIVFRLTYDYINVQSSKLFYLQLIAIAIDYIDILMFWSIALLISQGWLISRKRLTIRERKITPLVTFLGLVFLVAEFYKTNWLGIFFNNYKLTILNFSMFIVIIFETRTTIKILKSLVDSFIGRNNEVASKFLGIIMTLLRQFVILTCFCLLILIANWMFSYLSFIENGDQFVIRIYIEVVAFIMIGLNILPQYTYITNYFIITEETLELIIYEGDINDLNYSYTTYTVKLPSDEGIINSKEYQTNLSFDENNESISEIRDSANLDTSNYSMISLGNKNPVIVINPIFEETFSNNNNIVDKISICFENIL